MKIVASTCCPVGDAAGHDADECRANLLENDAIACHSCATTYPKLSTKMRLVYRAICSVGFHAPKVELGSPTQPGTREYNAACLSGYDPAQSDRVQATFKRDKQTVKLDYERSNEHEIDNSDRSLHRELSASELAGIPQRVQDCIAALCQLGFSLRHYGADEPSKRIVLTCGRSVGSMGAVIGANVQISWT